MDKLQKPEQAGSLLVLHNCKHSTSALIHHLPCFSNIIVCFFLCDFYIEEKVFHTVKLKTFDEKQLKKKRKGGNVFGYFIYVSPLTPKVHCKQ